MVITQGLQGDLPPIALPAEARVPGERRDQQQPQQLATCSPGLRPPTFQEPSSSSPALPSQGAPSTHPQRPYLKEGQCLVIQDGFRRSNDCGGRSLSVSGGTGPLDPWPHSPGRTRRKGEREGSGQDLHWRALLKNPLSSQPSAHLSAAAETMVRGKAGWLGEVPLQETPAPQSSQCSACTQAAHPSIPRCPEGGQPLSQLPGSCWGTQKERSGQGQRRGHKANLPL